ncbi:MAG: phosphoadenylyl-sulfate reductase [Acidimicrobiia bacterium]|nr:phosphoadenylyl-sulfate reductase [Acidimicrobiia bacterium]
MTLPPHPDSLSAQRLLAWALETYGRRFALCTSFQAEGTVILDIAHRISPDVRVFTIDTGRLPAETYQLIDAVRARYGIAVEIVAPDYREVEKMTTQHGVNLFYRDPSYRKLCCHVRKVRPLERKLAELDAWAVGLRREQSQERAGTEKLAVVDGRVKLSPLADWTKQQVEDYVTAHELPRHPLVNQGYPSIGCAPCTRAVLPGEEERAGRWWWETGDAKECGLHVTPDGQMQRTLDVLLEDILVG